LHKRIRRSTSRPVFTGLVEEKGTLVARRSKAKDDILRIQTGLTKLLLGESISVEGACLTVAKLVPDGFEADVSAETLARTTLGSLSVGAQVNLERSLAMGDRLGGHLVSGHVDATCALAAKSSLGDAIKLTFRFEPRLARFIAEKGSIAVNGVSLTVNAVGRDSFEVAIIPHTREKTTLGTLAVGSLCNLEVDLLARYLARLLEVGRAEDVQAPATEGLARALERAGLT
jgi:riboflavin synthase